jgi:hypothetical protein
VNAQLDQIIAGFPNQVALQACSDSAERVPVVLYSAVDALHSGTATSELEAEVFAGVTPVTSPSLTLSAQRIAVLRTLEMKEPEASLIEPTIGHFQAYLVVFDAHTKQPLCQTHIEATSAKDTRWSNVSARALHDDFVAGVRKSLFAAANRLHVELEL